MTKDKRYRIGLDVDGVLADFSTAFSSLGRALGLTLDVRSADEQPTWDFDWPTDKAWRIVDTSINWWEKVPALLDQEDVNDINNLLVSHKVYFLTNRPDSSMPYNRTAEEQTRNWLRGIGIFPHIGTILSVPNKAEVAKALHLDVILEDSPANLEDLIDHGVYCVKMSRPYNEAFSGNANVTSIEEFCKKLPTFVRHSRASALVSV